MPVSMTTRERFLATMRFEPCDHPPLWEWAYWVETLQLWYTQGLKRQSGLPDSLPPSEPISGDAGDWRPGMPREKDAHDALHLDEGYYHLPIHGGLRVPTDIVVIEEDDRSRVFIDTDGVRKRVLKDSMSMPGFLSFPVQTRRDWEELQSTLDTSFATRVPSDWSHVVANLRNRTFPVALGGYPEGLYGDLRALMGPEVLSTTFYDDPDLIHDMLNTLTEMWINLWEEAVSQVEVDGVTFWEDMCYRSGPLISPRMFREFLSPCYRRVTDFCRGKGIEVFLVDSDGDMRSLIPLWMEAGITGVYPFEVQANMNVEEIGRAYPTLQLLGGIDKREVAKGKAAIDRELEKRLPSLLQRGGYIPTLDHHVTPEVSWQDFLYYRQRVAEMCERYSPGAGK